MSGCLSFLKNSLQGGFMDVLFLLGKMSEIPVCWKCVIFSSQNQTQIMKTMSSDSSSWYFLQTAKRWKLAIWGREKSVINFFYIGDIVVSE